MTEPTKTVFSRNSDDESDRIPENGGTPRVSDTLVEPRDLPMPTTIRRRRPTR